MAKEMRKFDTGDSAAAAASEPAAKKGESSDLNHLFTSHWDLFTQSVTNITQVYAEDDLPLDQQPYEVGEPPLPPPLKSIVMWDRASGSL